MEINSISITNVSRNSNFIGHSYNYSAGDLDFKGVMDEVRLYNRALTAAEVTALYQQGTTPSITSITPTVAVLNQPTTFTVKGTNLTSGMGFTVSDCEASTVNGEVGTGSSIKRQFKCTPRGTAGQKTGMIKNKPKGNLLYNFDVKILPSATPPIIVDVKPKVAVLNVPTEFTVYGGNLTNGMGFTIADCDTSNTEIITKRTPISRTFSCNIRGTTAGRRVGIVKNAPKQLALHYFDVYVKKVATDPVPALAATNQIVYNSNLKIINVSQLRGITEPRVVFSPQMKTAISSWVAGKTMFKIGSMVRKVRAIYPPNANGTIPIDTSIPEQGDFLNSLKVSAVNVPLRTANLAGGISENTTPSLRIEARSSVAAKSAHKISSENTIDTYKFIITNHVLYDADGDFINTKGDQVLLNGSLIVEKPVVTFTYEDSFYPSPRAIANLTFNASEKFDLTISSHDFSFKTSKGILLGQFIVPIPASGGTVYGRLSLYLNFDADGKAQISATMGEEVRVNFGYTAKLENGAFNFTHHKDNLAVFNKPTVTAVGALNAELKLQAGLSMMVFDYDLTGVTANAGPALNLASKLVNTVSCSNFGLTLNANASAYMMIPEVTIPDGYWGWLDTEVRMVERTSLLFNQNLFSKSYILGSPGCTETP